MDSSWRLTRRQVVKRGVAASVIVAIGLDAQSAAAVEAEDNGVLGGVLARVLGRDSAIVTIAGHGPTRVTLAPEAFVSHGVDGVTSDLSAFVPGERVAVRGSFHQGTITAEEFQSVYTEDVGVVVADARGRLTLKTSNGTVAVPPDVAVRSTSGGTGTVRSGANSAATLWTNPATGERTALMLRADD